MKSSLLEWFKYLNFYVGGTLGQSNKTFWRKSSKTRLFRGHGKWVTAPLRNAKIDPIRKTRFKSDRRENTRERTFYPKMLSRRIFRNVPKIYLQVFRLIDFFKVMIWICSELLSLFPLRTKHSVIVKLMNQ